MALIDAGQQSVDGVLAILEGKARSKTKGLDHTSHPIEEPQTINLISFTATFVVLI